MGNKKVFKKVSEKSKITTIKLLEETKIRIEKLKEHKKESYDDILRKVLYVLNLVREEPEKAKITLKKIEGRRNQMLEEDKKREEDLKKEIKKRNN